MPVDGAFWRSLREDLESLQAHQFSLIWNSSTLPGFRANMQAETGMTRDFLRYVDGIDLTFSLLPQRDCGIHSRRPMQRH
jgi:hypothetical protein